MKYTIAMENTTLLQFDTFEEFIETLCSIAHDRKLSGDKYFDIEIVNQEEGFKDCYETEIVYDNTQDAYICSNCGAYIVDRVDSKDINYRFPKSCSECHCEF